MPQLQCIIRGRDKAMGCLISTKSNHQLENKLGRAKLTVLYNAPDVLSTEDFAGFPDQFLHFVELLNIANTCSKHSQPRIRSILLLFFTNTNACTCYKAEVNQACFSEQSSPCLRLHFLRHRLCCFHLSV